MAHNIMEGKRMFYVGKEPWHGLGVKLENPATAAEAISAAQLNYPLELKGIKTEDGVVIPDSFATVRGDTGTPLGIVGNYYTPVQNVEAFDFFDGVVGEKLAMYHTAGALGQGERIWILAKLPDIIQVTAKDIVEKYLLLTNSHDGKSSLRMFFTPVRVVCQNTLNAAISSAKDGISIRHTGNINNKLKEAQRALGIAMTFYSEFEESLKVMAKKNIKDEEATLYFSSLILNDSDVEISTRKQNQIDDLLGLYNQPEYPEARGTLWGAYNAVTNYTDHFRSVKNDNTSNRLESIWFGSGADLKVKAYNTAMVLAKN